MTPARVLTFGHDVPAAALALLAANGPAAWLIDIAGGRIPAANTAGSALLGLDCLVSQPLLDASMPALAWLRQRVHEVRPDDAKPKRLVFWGAHGALQVRCRVQILGMGPKALALVIALDESKPVRPAGSHEPARPLAASDTATLKDLARKIREGQMTRLQPAHPPASRDASLPDVHRAAPPPELPFSIRSSLAHELKTPVSAIAAAAEIMQDERFGPLGNARYAGYARDIHGSAQHVLNVIERMLAEGRADADAPLRDADITEIDVGGLLEDAVSQLIPIAERAGLALILALAPRLPHVIADATSLRQIVFNLATNAFKFTGRGGRVTIAARYEGDGPLSISVSDTGAGLSAREVERLLTPGGAAQTRSQGGTAHSDGLGLGLPLVQALAAANGAKFHIESTPGAGTSASLVFGKGRIVPV